MTRDSDWQQPLPSTSWRIVAIDNPSPGLRSLRIDLTVGTTAEAVVEAIEEAAERNGIVLQRIHEPA